MGPLKAAPLEIAKDDPPGLVSESLAPNRAIDPGLKSFEIAWRKFLGRLISR
jgi:hypothetical protein